jgi:hypothetical protein
VAVMMLGYVIQPARTVRIARSVFSWRGHRLPVDPCPVSARTGPKLGDDFHTDRTQGSRDVRAMNARYGVATSPRSESSK